jgi:geranylgeranyl pyrophosphate synthase
MRDDLLDIIDGHGDKTSFSDHQEGNQTFLLAHAFETATPEQQRYLLDTRGTVCDEPTKKQLLAIYTDT